MFKFIVSSVQWSFLAQNDDTCFGFQAERGEIFDYIRDNAISGVVLLSGDRHWIGVFRHEQIEPFYLYEFSSSPLGAAVSQAPAPDPETLYLDATGRAYITIHVDTTVSPATIDARVLDESGVELHLLSLTEDDINATVIFADGFESGGTSAWSQTTR